MDNLTHSAQDLNTRYRALAGLMPFLLEKQPN